MDTAILEISWHGLLIAFVPTAIVIGIIAIAVLGLQNELALVVITAAAAPIGFNSVTLASIGKLDVEHRRAPI